ncbi:DUF1826 domain-containing protein [Colwellia sp. E2M01]|uniref:DUF1826 domain-containing protein n=1 Tax=Colwellia sp. E2M01 TaxID=2841561 RepID=UPI001C086CC8|nr:DUF1826 domain-containing protein [Colwellia sp. E2M01]MBU2869079.1 DUF1826 domain-containing protein [Colwellia sp. E2M01]
MGVVTENTVVFNELTATSPHSKESDDANVLTNIYRDDTNITVWQREMQQDLTAAVGSFLHERPTRATVLAVTPESAYQQLCEKFGASEDVMTLSKDIALLVDMFCCLFDLKQAGLRLSILEHAMCPRFHVDHIPCRLVTTYRGVGTQWLPHYAVDRTKLGAGNQGKPDEISGLFNDIADINQLTQGDVALLKGEGWNEQTGAGIVHRSPVIPAGERRLILTLDFMND